MIDFTARLVLIIILPLAICISPIYAQDSQPQGKGDLIVVEKSINPINLESDWLENFSVESDALRTQSKKLLDQLKSLQDELQENEDKENSAKLVKEISLLFESLIILKEKTIVEPLYSWVPKNHYSLTDYINLSDRALSLSSELEYRQTELKYTNSEKSEVRQIFRNLYAKYLGITNQTTEKFLLSLEVISHGIKYLNLQAESNLIQSYIKHDKKKLQQLTEERELVKSKLNSESFSTIDENEIIKLKASISKAQNSLMELEADSIQTHEENIQTEVSHLIAIRLCNVFIEEALLKSQLTLLNAKSLLFDIASKSIAEKELFERLDEIEKFEDEYSYQAKQWMEKNLREMENIGQAFVLTQKETSEDLELSNLYKDSLKLIFSNRAMLNDLSKKLYHLDLVIDLIQDTIVDKKTKIDVAQYYLSEYWDSFSTTILTWFSYSLTEIGGVPVTLTGLFKACLIIICAYWLSHFIGQGLKKIAAKKGAKSEATTYTFHRIIHYLILFLGFITALSSIGMTLNNMTIVLGALSVGIGFGLQNQVNNFLSGLTILFERNLKIGDYIELSSGHLGKITEVNVQNTTLHTFDGMDILIPNSLVIGSEVINWTKNDPYQRIQIPFGVAYGTDQDLVSKVAIEAAHKVPYTVLNVPGKRNPEVWLVELGESSLNFELVVWVKLFQTRGRRATIAHYLSEIEKALKRAKIAIPFPQRDIHIIPKSNQSSSSILTKE